MIRLLLAMLILSGAASAQSVQQSGTVTPGHVPTWTTNGVIQDGGTPGSPQITGGIGVANSNQRSICTQNSKTGAVSQLCLGSTANGTFLTSSTLSGPPQPFFIQVNGANFPIPASLLPFPYLDARSFGVKADGVTSDDVAMKAAFDACSLAGTALYLPAGRILMTGAAGPITIQNCAVQGSGVPGGKTSVPSQGTMLLLTSTTVKPFLAANNWSWSGTNFFWPGQTTGAVVYPPLLNVEAPTGGCNWRFFNNVVANAYDFVDDTTGAGVCEGDWFIRDNIIYVMHYGISSVGQGDEIHVNHNAFTPGAWFNIDPTNSATAVVTARQNNWAFHVKNTAGKAWNIIAKDNDFFAWRGGFLLDATGVVAISDVSMVTDFVNTLIDTSSGGNWAAGNGFNVKGNCKTFIATGHSAPCFNMGANGVLEVKSSTLSATGSIVETAGSSVTLQSTTISSLGNQNDGTEYYGIHYTSGGAGVEIIFQDSTVQGNALSNKAHVHGITTDTAVARAIIQNNQMNFLQEEINIQSAATNVITGNWSVGTNSASSVLISGTTGVQFSNNNFDKLANSTLSACGGATVANGAFSGFFTVGATNPTTSCSLTFPFALTGAGGGACQFQPSTNLVLWANASGSPATWVVQSSADMHSQNVFFTCRAAQ